jgi:predicted DCC family thiol-disulfide oxidoreductase YuxK
MNPALYEACRRAAHVVTVDGQVLRAGRAVMFVLLEVGYPAWLIWPLTWPPLVWFTELGYWLIANNRMFFSKFLFKKER